MLHLRSTVENADGLSDATSGFLAWRPPQAPQPRTPIPRFGVGVGVGVGGGNETADQDRSGPFTKAAFKDTVTLACDGHNAVVNSDTVIVLDGKAITSVTPIARIGFSPKCQVFFTQTAATPSRPSTLRFVNVDLDANESCASGPGDDLGLAMTWNPATEVFFTDDGLTAAAVAQELQKQTLLITVHDFVRCTLVGSQGYNRVDSLKLVDTNGRLTVEVTGDPSRSFPIN